MFLYENISKYECKLLFPSLFIQGITYSFSPFTHTQAHTHATLYLEFFCLMAYPGDIFMSIHRQLLHKLCFGQMYDGKESACNAEDPGLIPGSRRPPREEHGNPLQYSFLENSMGRGAWQTTVHVVTESDVTERLTHMGLHSVHVPWSTQPAPIDEQVTFIPLYYKQGCHK